MDEEKESQGSSGKEDGSTEQPLEEDKRPRSTRYNIWPRAAKNIRQEHIRTQAVRSMAESAKRTSEAIEEHNAITAFPRPEASELPKI